MHTVRCDKHRRRRQNGRDQRADHAASAARKVIALGGAESDQKAEPARQDRKIHADEHIRQRADAGAGERAQRAQRRIARPFLYGRGRPVRRGGLLGFGRGREGFGGGTRSRCLCRRRSFRFLCRRRGDFRFFFRWRDDFRFLFQSATLLHTNTIARSTDVCGASADLYRHST